MKKALQVIGVLFASFLVTVGIIGYEAYAELKNKKIPIEVVETTISADDKQKNYTITEEDASRIPNLDRMDGYEAIAIIKIPSINLTQMLMEGIEENVIKYHLGHFPDAVMPGEKGNFSISGHRITDYTDGLINLYKVLAGDEIIVKTKNEIFVYEVTEKFLVDPSDVYVLDDTEDATMTIVTCSVGAEERVIVKGKLIYEGN